MISPWPWRNDADPVVDQRRKPYRRVYDANGTSVARVYHPDDADIIAVAPQLRDLAFAIACGKTVSRIDAANLYRAAGGMRPVDPIPKGPIDVCDG